MARHDAILLVTLAGRKPIRLLIASARRGITVSTEGSTSVMADILLMSVPARVGSGYAVLKRATRARDVSASCDSCTIVAVISSAAAAFDVAIERSCDMLPSSWV